MYMINVGVILCFAPFVLIIIAPLEPQYVVDDLSDCLCNKIVHCIHCVHMHDLLM